MISVRTFVARPDKFAIGPALARRIYGDTWIRTPPVRSRRAGTPPRGQHEVWTASIEHDDTVGVMGYDAAVLGVSTKFGLGTETGDA